MIEKFQIYEKIASELQFKNDFLSAGDHQMDEIAQSASSVSTTEARRAKVLEVIRSLGFGSIPDLKDAVKASESTIRRDLDYLEELGEVKRTHGGVLFTGPGSGVSMFQDAAEGNWEQKRAIAQEAAKCIEDRDTILLDGGSTTYELARCLVGRPLQIVTNSLPVTNLFAASQCTDLVFLGGQVHRTGITMGSRSIQMLEGIRVQKAFLSVAGIDRRGYYNSNLTLVETERAMMQSADQTVVVADSSKFGRSSLAQLCQLSEIDRIVVDTGLSNAWKQMLEAAGTKVILAATNHADAESKPEHAIASPHWISSKQPRQRGDKKKTESQARLTKQ